MGRTDLETLSLVNPADIRKELFKRGSFDFICTQNGKVHEKQKKALQILVDDETSEFAYGGAAGGAKSWTGCAWLTFMSLCYPGTRWFVGRKELKRITESTLITFFKVFKQYGISEAKYNGQYHYIQFQNGSRIDMLDLSFLPSDPLYERYGSIEYTGGWIEEGGEVHFGAYDTLKTRVGRHYNDKYGILGKILVTLNPKKNWCHHTFWKPFKLGILPKCIKFLQALATDNPFNETGYLEKLKAIKDIVRRERLLMGNFDYDDDEHSLIDYDKLLDIFTNEHCESEKRYITADIARFGKDKTVIMCWAGWEVKEIYVISETSITTTAELIKDLAKRAKIPMSSVVVDEDGVGGGVVDILKCQGFVNNSKPLPNPITHKDENYSNLKSQCYFILSTMINDGKVSLKKATAEQREMITQELEQVKQKEVDNDGKKSVIGKDVVKEIIGRSPDYSDTIMMRVLFDIKPRMSAPTSTIITR